MTWPDVVDTAVKIGLGGLVAGVSAYFIARRSHTHDLKKERLRRIQDGLEEVSREFEKAHVHFIERCATSYHLNFTTSAFRDSTKEPRDIANAALRESKEKFLKMHELEGRLLLLGMPGSARLLRDYRVAATKIEDVPIAAADAPKRLGPVADELCRLKETIYTALSQEYKGA